MSGSDGDQLGNHGLIRSEVQFIAKPFSAAELSRSVRRAFPVSAAKRAVS